MISYSIINKSQLEGAMRLDAEYYQPEFLQTVALIKNNENKRLGDMISTLTDYHANGSYEILKRNVQLSDSPNYALMVRAVDLEKNAFEDDVRYVSEHAYNFLKKTKLYGNEIIIDKIGNAGEVFIMPDLKRPVTLGMNLFMLRLEPDYDPVFVYIFLIGKYGKALISQRITGTVPTSIDKASVRGILIPIPSEAIVTQIRSLVENRQIAIENSISFYQQATDLLLDELGLKDFKKEEILSYIVLFSETQKVDRIDAEYFDPVYVKVGKILNKFRQVKLEGASSLISYGTVPTSPYVEEGVPYAKGENLQNCFIDYSKLDFLEKESTKKLPQKVYLKENDIIISQMGTVGRAAVATKMEEGWLFASFTIRVRLSNEGLKLVDPLFLTLFINNVSRPYYLLRRIAQASVRQNTDLPTIRDLEVPILPTPTQQKIASLVRKSHEARKKSKELLEEAKRKVEEIIEKGANV